MEVKIIPAGYARGYKNTKASKQGKKWRPNKKKKNNKVKTKIRPVKSKLLDAKKWAVVRYKALKLNNGKCQCCGRSGHETILHVDHIKPKSRYPELMYTLSNLQVLCAACNYGKNWRDETDWRPEEMKERFLNAMAAE